MSTMDNYEAVHRDSSNPITIFHWKNHYTIHNHWHEHIELLYFVKGYALVHCGQNMYEVNGGEIIIVNSNELHKCDYMEKDTEYYCLVISPSFFYVKDFNDCVFKNHVICNDIIKKHFSTIISEYQAQGLGYETVIKGELYNLLIYLLRNYCFSTDTAPRHERKVHNVNKVNTVVQYINEHFSENISISDIAKEIYCSESYLQHIFKNEIGKSIVEYINFTRINAAIKYLKLENMQIKEISDKIGFNDYNYFSRVFKKNTGMTPIEYRKKFKKSDTCTQHSKSDIVSAHNKQKSHNLTLPAWGPYNKKYAGFSHIADKKTGLRLDVDIFPGFFRRKVITPVTIADCGAKAWASSPDFSHTVYRYELEWKDKIYCDVHMYQKDGNCRFVCDFVNNTGAKQSLQTNLVFSLRLPTSYHMPFDIYTVNKLSNTVWINAVDYEKISIEPYLPVDGTKLGEERFLDFTDSNGISEKFFSKHEDFLEYNIDTEANSIGIRYTSKENATLLIIINEDWKYITLTKTDTPKFYSFSIPKTHIRSIKITNTGIPVSIDGLAVGIDVGNISFTRQNSFIEPEITKKGSSLSLKYPMVNHTYNISCDNAEFIVREFHGDDIGSMLTNATHNHTQDFFSYEKKHHYTDLFLRPIYLDSYEKKQNTIDIKLDSLKTVPEESETFSFKPNKSGERYLFSQNLMSAVTLMNVSYPIYCRGEYILHNTPGKNWDSLYTWDSGFIGLGLAAIDRKRACECLNTYLTLPGDIHSPFILHGTPLATQALLYQELYNSSCDKEFAESFYSAMKQFYEYFGNLHKDKNQPNTGLIKTWHLFYNSGGWDDYPPQQYTHQIGGEDKISPVITTAYTVIFGKIMFLIAQACGNTADCDSYLADIKRYEKALQCAWDEESGYFGYVVHDKYGNKKDILKNDTGENFNKGMDGVYPYISGSTTLEQNQKIIKNINNNLFTPYGVSVVDTTASYFSDSGYWNGSVWMPHQWILWKSLLDHGELEFANKIAETALELWQSEVDLTYNCFEHFMLKTGRGAGFHQFSGLSTPVLLWYKSYHIPGTLTTGFMTIIKSVSWNEDKTAVTFSILSHIEVSYVLVCLKDGFEYSFEGADEIHKVFDGTYIVKTDKDVKITAKKSRL